MGLLAGVVVSDAFSGMVRAEELSDALIMRYPDVINMQETICSGGESTGNLITAPSSARWKEEKIFLRKRSGN